jgi:hypothetical protein
VKKLARIHFLNSFLKPCLTETITRMFAKESFLRRLPVSLNLEQRLQFEALVHASDVITLNLKYVRGIASKYGKRVGSISKAERTTLISLIWSVIDQAHVIRQLFEVMLGHDFDASKPSNEEKFHTKYSGVTRLRNKMDHLKDNIPNLARSKVKSPPIYGILSYFHCAPDDFPKGSSVPSGGRIVTITSGTLTHTHKLPIVNPLGKTSRLPVGCMQFAAFDEVIELDELELELAPLLRGLEGQIERVCKEKIQLAASEQGLPIEKLMENAAGDIVLILEVGFSADGTAVAAEKPGK